MRIACPLFDPTSETAAGGAPTPPKVEPQKTDAELASLRAELENVKKTASSWQDTVVMLDASKPANERMEATRRVMAATGKYSKEEIESHIQSAFAEETPEETVEDAPEETPSRQGPAPEYVELREQVVKLKRAAIKDQIKTNVDSAIQQNETVNKLYERLVVLKGKEKADAALKAIKSRIFDVEKEDGLVVGNLRKKVEANRGKFEESWIKDEVERITSDEAQRYLSVIEDIDVVGRSSETVAGAREFLASKPVEAPKWAPGKTRGQIEAELEAYTKDSLSRVAMAAAKPRI